MSDQSVCSRKPHSQRGYFGTTKLGIVVFSKGTSLGFPGMRGRLTFMAHCRSGQSLLPDSLVFENDMANSRRTEDVMWTEAAYAVTVPVLPSGHGLMTDLALDSI